MISTLPSYPEDPVIPPRPAKVVAVLKQYDTMAIEHPVSFRPGKHSEEKNTSRPGPPGAYNLVGVMEAP